MQLTLRKTDLRPFHQADDEQQDHSTDRGVDDGSEKPPADMDTEVAEQPGADEGTDDANDYVANQAKANPFDDNASKPTGNRADDDEDDQCFQ